MQYYNNLNSIEAKNLLKKYGENKIISKKKQSNISRFLHQFEDVMIIILIIAAIISFFLALKNMEISEFFESGLILIIVILNAIMGTVQENKAEKSLEALKNLSAPNAKVIRDNKKQIIPASQLVPNDLILIETGDLIPADAKLVESVNLKSNESILTGESVSVLKNIEEKNMIFSGCNITYGRGYATVVATGMDTKIGKIANMIQTTEKSKTPLQNKLKKLGKYIGIVTSLICAIIFVIGLISGIPISQIFMTSVSLAVAAIPEGLPAVVTIILAIGVQKMVNKNAIIRKLPAVETLGSASVICSDKTGTLTKNQMTLTTIYNNKTQTIESMSENNSAESKNILKLMTLCCDGSIIYKNDKIEHIGDPTETSIVFAAYKNNIKKEDLDVSFKRVKEIPFDSKRKLMTVVCKYQDKYIVITKGAFEKLYPLCSTKNLKESEKIIEKLSGQALRILCVATKEIENIENIKNCDLENNLNFLGFVGMIDPPRDEVKNSIKTCISAGIKTIMITGDNILTSSAIAKNLGILNSEKEAITGEELKNISDHELQTKIKNFSVYARVTPEDKIRIVKAWQSQNNVVAMTGDGVNDAPALKAADIGCAMGITGTDVAKEAADIILTDDNFSTIVHAIKEGRGIYDNIKKTIVFLLGSNIGELLTVFFSMILWGQSPLLSMHLLWINFVTDSFPAIALGREPINNNIMNRKPTPKDKGIFANGLGIKVLLHGILFAVLTLFGFMYTWRTTGNINSGRTAAFIILAFGKVLHSFNIRSEESLFKTGFFSNKYLNKATILSTILIAIVVFIPPIQKLFFISNLNFLLYTIIISICFFPILIFELLKYINCKRRKLNEI